MKYQRHPYCLSHARFVRALRFWSMALLACLSIFAVTACGQEEAQEPPLAETHATGTLPDALLPQITAALQGVATPDSAALAKALHIGDRLEGAAPGAAPNTLALLGDLEGTACRKCS